MTIGLFFHDFQHFPPTGRLIQVPLEASNQDLLMLNRETPFSVYTLSSYHVPLIGMLIGWELPEMFLEACHRVAKAMNAQFFYFYPQHVDERNRQIIGTCFENGRWVKQTFPYPNVIYDRMRRRGNKYEHLYNSFSPIPITHDLLFGRVNKSTIYQMTADHPVLSSCTIPYQLLDTSLKTVDFIKSHRKVVLKPLNKSNGRSILTVSWNGEHFEIFDQTYMHQMDEDEFMLLLKQLKRQRFFVQKFIESKTKEGYPTHTRVHLMKDGEGRWAIAFIFTSFSLTPYISITNHANAFRSVTKWEWFLKSQFDKTQAAEMDANIKEYSMLFASCAEDRFGSGFHEIGIDFGIDTQGQLTLFEANMNNVGMNFHEYETARFGIAYALYLTRTAGKTEQGLHKGRE